MYLKWTLKLHYMLLVPPWKKKTWQLISLSPLKSEERLLIATYFYHRIWYSAHSVHMLQKRASKLKKCDTYQRCYLILSAVHTTYWSMVLTHTLPCKQTLKQNCLCCSEQIRLARVGLCVQCYTHTLTRAHTSLPTLSASQLNEHHFPTAPQFMFLLHL